MDLSLKEIKQILSYHDFKRIALALKEAEKNADKKIKELKELVNFMKLKRKIKKNITPNLSKNLKKEKYY